MRSAIVAIGLLAVSGVVACGAPTPPPAPPATAPPATEASSTAPSAHGAAHGGPRAELPACAVLAKTCHARDKDSEKAHECHLLGHRSTSNDACEAKRAECLATCGTGDGGP
ncbi:MAG: hypothetical protein JST00_06710 [Deltaproteobacteria bacterium]|nr:hypothetical protein [Deltaproteobacteria bacterium]